MKLTDDGERCYQHARRLLAAWSTLEDEVSHAGDEPVGTLRVRAPHAFGQEQLLAPLTRFLGQHPQLSVEWLLNDKNVDFLSANIDCAIRVGAEIDPSTVSVLLAEVPRSVVIAPALLADYPAVTGPQQLAALPWVALSTFYQHSISLTHTAGEVEQVTIAPRLYTDSLYVARSTALQGLGAVIISSWAVAEDLREGRLVNLLPDWEPAPLPVHLVYPWARYYPARLRAFLQMMREAVPGITGMRLPASEA